MPSDSIEISWLVFLLKWYGPASRLRETIFGTDPPPNSRNEPLTRSQEFTTQPVLCLTSF